MAEGTRGGKLRDMQWDRGVRETARHREIIRRFRREKKMMAIRGWK